VTVDELPYPDATELADHWWWRPGWQVGTRFYAWHVTLDDQPALRQLASDYQSALTSFRALDLIPERWLHITMQGIDHAREVPDADRDDLVAAVHAQLAALPVEQVTFHRPVLHREAVVVPPTDPEPLRRIRRAVRDGMAEALAPRPVPESDHYRPHFSLAYVNASTDPAGIRHALDGLTAAPVTAHFTRVALIEMHRDHRMYEWRTITHVAIGQA
jgi:hypothetical protein